MGSDPGRLAFRDHNPTESGVAVPMGLQKMSKDAENRMTLMANAPLSRITAHKRGDDIIRYDGDESTDSQKVTTGGPVGPKPETMK
jgi:hypothetical protein